MRAGKQHTKVKAYSRELLWKETQNRSGGATWNLIFGYGSLLLYSDLC